MKSSRLNLLPPLLLLFALHSATFAGVVKDHQGHWMGELKLPDGRGFKTGIELFSRADGSSWASFTSPDQGRYDVPLTSMAESDDAVELGFGAAVMAMTWAGDRFKAQWKQGGAVFPLELTQVSEFPRTARPQNPVAPFPYSDETLAIVSADGTTLGATLSTPHGRAKPNVVILVHGAGPATRDQESDGHRTFAVLADYLARQGIAVLRYDKRGISRSTGIYESHTQPQLADDLSAVVKAVKARHQFAKIGLIGHSEGPMIAATVAARHPSSVDFLVSMAGVGLPGLELILLQDRLTAIDNGAPVSDLPLLMAYTRRFYEIVIAEAETDSRSAALTAFQKSLPEATVAMVEKYKMNEGSLSLRMASEPALRVFLMANPQQNWKAVRCPVLALNGSLDHQVPPESMAGIVASLRAGGNRRVESVLIPSLNHQFQTAKTGSEEEYGAIDETIAPIALQRIAAFAVRQR